MKKKFRDHIPIIPQHMDRIVHTLASAIVERDTLQNILETMANAVFLVSRTLVIMRANQAAQTLLGYTNGTLVGTHVHDIFFDRACWTKLRLEQPDAENDGMVRDKELCLRNRVGEQIPVLFSASVLCSQNGWLDGFVCAAYDISEHIHLRHALQASRRSFQAIVERSADGILILSDDGQVEYINPSAMILLGRDRAEMIGMPFGFPVVSGDVTEVDILQKNGEVGIAEMRTVTTYWNHHDALLVSLRDVTENVRLREQLQQMSMEDELTGLHNRRGFLLLAEQEWKTAVRNKTHFVLFFIDLDGMKQINDKLGHLFGDQALMETAAILRQVFRKSDILARQGGDEFLVLSAQAQKTDNTADIIARLESEVARRNAQPHCMFQLSLSIGAVPVETTGDCAIENHIRQADTAMYAHKTAKKKSLRIG
jgi:diguanylate cyclase (GGDEF)-like protein/PAS domain S-box-containing protein